MKKSTARVIILVLIILLQKVDQTEGFAAGGGGCMQPVHPGSLGRNSGGNKPNRGNSLEVNVGQKKRNGDHWNVKYTNNPNDHNINVQAGGQKPNGDHWSVDYTHDMGGKH